MWHSCLMNALFPRTGKWPFFGVLSHVGGLKLRADMLRGKDTWGGADLRSWSNAFVEGGCGLILHGNHDVCRYVESRKQLRVSPILFTCDVKRVVKPEAARTRGMFGDVHGSLVLSDGTSCVPVSWVRMFWRSSYPLLGWWGASFASCCGVAGCRAGD